MKLTTITVISLIGKHILSVRWWTQQQSSLSCLRLSSSNARWPLGPGMESLSQQVLKQGCVLLCGLHLTYQVPVSFLQINRLSTLASVWLVWNRFLWNKSHEFHLHLSGELCGPEVMFPVDRKGSSLIWFPFQGSLYIFFFGQGPENHLFYKCARWVVIYLDKCIGFSFISFWLKI